MKRVASLALVALVTFVAPLARADDPAAAQALFSDAKKLMSAGKYAEACPKLEESERLASATGTKFNLADCYEHTGKIASAWAGFLSVAAAAKNANQAARERAARERAAAIEPSLSRLAISVSDAARGSGIEVKRDDEVIGEAQWGEAMPIDPGEHTVTASAPGKRAWKAIVAVEGSASRAKVVVPPLDDEPVAAPAPTATAPASSASLSPPPPAAVNATAPAASPLPWVLVGVGGAAVIGGAVVWILRGSIESRLDAECGSDQLHCPASATDDISNGKTYTALGIGLFALGGVSLVGGGALLLANRGSSAPVSARVVPSFDPRAPGLRFVGTF